MQFRASHILVKDKALAQKIAIEAKQGGNFAMLARKYSTCPSKSKGGDLGWFSPGQMVPPFENAVKKLSHNRISDPVKTQFGYHIIKKTGIKE
ncbi:MAG: peptidylprolyl isomerase [Sphaerochaetaceae bacterium]|jgi:peptidyl-prolyl cis-trans isomerase C|nr:peptidylprolyl isomerase [Sphaerochaetaceae bacterium]MDC7237070.1 peptidylprolyl isomerase [Sphaerochaetaceae bacterium]MDC7243361.1 peptidylprolyl isomerase [Sphaerochaetaceae bacterium]